MKNKIKKQILDDFNKTYSINIDREKILNNLEIKEPKENKVISILKLQRQRKFLIIAMSILIVCMISIVVGIKFGIQELEEKQQFDCAFAEFEEYIVEHTNYKSYKWYSEIIFKEEKVLIYKSSYTTNDITKNIYFYFIDYDEDKTCTIEFNNQKITANHLDYGILYEINEGEEVILDLTITYGKKTKNLALTLK